MNIELAREQFPALKDKVFLDSACVSVAPSVAVEAIQEFLGVVLHCPARSSTDHHILLDEMRTKARTQVARLIECREDEIALVESTTHALNIAANALPLERGDRIVMSDLEFMEVGIPWCQKRDEMGLEIDVVPNRQGQVLVEDLASRVTPRTKAIVVSAVQWSNGFRVDLSRLSEFCRGRSIYLIVDAIQQLGANPINVSTTPIDMLACGGHKWLNAPFGAGILYIRKGLMPELRRPLAGYLSVDPPEGGWGNYFQTPEITPVREYAYVEEARRFETGGTSNYPGAIGLGASLQLILKLGQDAIAAHVQGLTNHLIAGLQKFGVEMVTPLEAKCRSGITTFTLGSRDKNLAAMNYLLDRRVLTSVRYTSKVGGVRVSCHLFNDRADIEKVLEHLQGFLRGKA
jgi:cysteine desulfurase / selenocysteine lyase